jgi:hypothetical protein
MDHVRLEHDNCREEHCGYCDGGLFTCKVCGASEGELPKSCPGETMTEKQRSAVMAGHIEYVDGKWISLINYNNGKPMFSSDGTMLDEHGNRSIFDDVDE